VHDPTNVLGRRFVAYFIDLALVGALSIVAFIATASESYSGVDIDDACTVLRSVSDSNDPCFQFGSQVYTWTGSQFALALLLSVLAAVVNHVFLQGITGATVGKLMTGLRVVDVQGGRCGIPRALVRWVLLFVDQLFCALVGLISVFTTHPHRRVGDMVANTYVVATADVGRPVLPPPPAYAPVYAQPGYAHEGYGAWQPPQAGAPAWGNQPATPAWGEPHPTAWGAQPQPAQPQPAQLLPQRQQWGTPVTNPEQSGWAAPQHPPSAPVPGPPVGPPPAPPPAPPAPVAPTPSSSERTPDSWWDRAVADDAADRED
jgi:uncharacterized RDD family membrane protein YckC